MGTPNSSETICAKVVSSPLAVGRHAGEHRGLAGEIQPHGAALPTARGQRRGGAHGTDLDVSGEADADVAAFFPRPRLLGAKLLVTHHLQRLVQRALVVAAVIGQPGGHRQREIVGLGEVLAAHLHRVHVQLTRDQVQGPLDHQRGLGPAGAAVGVGGDLVGEAAGGTEFHGRNLVAPADHQARQRRQSGGEELQVGARIQQGVVGDAQDGAVLLYRGFHRPHLSASVDRRLDVLAPSLDPLHRALELHRQVGQQRLLAVDVQLAAEAAAHLRGDDADAVFREPEHQRQHGPQEMRDLGRAPHGQLVLAREVPGHHAAGLHRDRRQPLVDELLLDDDVGVGAGLVHVPGAALEGEGLVAVPLGMDDGRARLQRLLQVRDRGQRLVVHLDQVEGVPGRIRVLGHHRGNRLSHVPHDLLGQHRVRRRAQRRIGRGAGHRAHAVADVPRR